MDTSGMDTKCKERALVVDDDVRSCELIRGVLGSNKMEALILTRSAAAAGHLWAEKFSIALLDLRMPSPDGVELTRRIRGSGINQQTPIVIMSDDQDPAALSEAFEAGANFFLYKPIDQARLVKLIRVTQGIIEHERRRFRRVPLRSKVRLRSGRVDLEGETIDVSLSGLLVCAERVLAPGTRADVSLYLSPGIKPVVGSGSIMRIVGKDRMGIQLDKLSTTESSRLEEFLLPITRHEWPQAAMSES
jgi:DNA-binding response OmpR family regulator